MSAYTSGIQNLHIWQVTTWAALRAGQNTSSHSSIIGAIQSKCVWAAYHNMTMSAALNSGPTTTPHKGCVMYCTSSTSHKGNLATWISYSPTALGRLRTERPACKTWRRYSAKTTGWQAISWIHIHLNHARWNDSPQCTEGISKPWVVYASLITSTIHCDRLSFDTARPFVHPP